MEFLENSVLIIKNLWKYLLLPNSSDLVNVYLSISVTAAVLFISISLIPFQQIASTQSFILLRYLRKSKSIILLLCLILLIVIIQLLIPLFDIVNLSVYLSAVLTLILFIIIAISWRMVIKLLDPQYFLLPEFIADIKNTFSECIKIAQNKTKSRFEVLGELEEKLIDSLYGDQVSNDNNGYYEIKKIDILPAFDKILLLKELILIYIKNNQTHLFEESMNYLEECINHYIELRKNYSKNSDDFLIEFSDDVEDIISAIENQNNIHYQRKIWRFIRSICITTGNINNNQSKNGYNTISKPYTDILFRRYTNDIANNKLDSAFEITRCIGQISEYWASLQIINSTVDLMEKLESISMSSLTIGSTNMTYISRQYIAKSFYNLCLYNKGESDYKFNFDRIIKIYQKILNSTKLTSIAIVDPIFWYSITGLGDQSISSITKLLLFPINYENENQYDFIQSQTQPIVDSLLNAVYTTIKSKGGSQDNFFIQLHQIGVYMLAYLYHKVSTDVLLGYGYITIPKEFQKQKIDELFGNLLDFQFDLIKNYWLGKERSIYSIDDVIHSFQSLIILDLYWSNLHDSKRFDIINGRIKKYFIQIKPFISDINLDYKELQSLSQIGSYIKNYKEFYKYGKIIKYLATFALRKDSYHYPRSFNKLKSIKRPLFGCIPTDFDAIDKVVFSKK